MPRPAGPPRDNERIRDISLAVYKLKIGAPGVARMLAADADGGMKLRNRAASYDNTTVCYLEALGLPVPRLTGDLLSQSDPAETPATIEQTSDPEQALEGLFAD